MEPFKNLFNKTTVLRISKALVKAWPQFDHKSFVKNSERDLQPLELKERVNYLAIKLHGHLPADHEKAIALLVKSLKHEKKNPDGLDQFSVWPLTHYVSLYGLDHFDISLNALKEMTKVFTSEFAVRAFFIKDEARTLAYMKTCSTDQNDHVRRWASEGSRPLLPWGSKLQCFVDNPEATWSLLETLKNDPSEYVRKSVANHVNDHSKNHPDLVIEKLLKWHHQEDKSPELSWVIKHSSRTLIKKGFKKAFLLHGVDDAKIKIVEEKILTKKIQLGEKLKVLVTLQNLSLKNEAMVILDHELHLKKASGKHLIKVFKGKKIKLGKGETATLEMSIPLKPVTTRVYYPGEQLWNVKINGVSGKPMAFKLNL